MSVSPISSLSLAHLLTPRSPRSLFPPFTIRPQALIDSGPRPTSPLPNVDDGVNDQASLYCDSDGEDPDDQYFHEVHTLQPSASSYKPFGSFSSSQFIEEEEDYNERVRDLPAAYIARLREVEYNDLGSMDKECQFCRAWHWAFERTNKLIKNKESSFKYLCCANGDGRAG